MINTVKPLTLGNHSTKEQVECQYKSSSEKHDRERLLTILMAYENNSLQHTGFTLKRGRATIGRWLKAYKEGGIEQLLKRKHGGRKASLPESCHNALTEKLYTGQCKKVKDIQSWLKTQHVELKLSAVYYWLYRSSWKLPRKSHIWVEDEHRYGLMSVIRRCWTIKGHRPKAKHKDKYEWIHTEQQI